MRFNVTIVKPWGYRFSESFRDVGETLIEGLRMVGHTAGLVLNRFEHGAAANIVLGAYLLDVLPSGSIVYNLEQQGSKSFAKTQRICEGSCVWDYSEQNIAAWRKAGVFAVHAPIGYAPTLTRIPTLPIQDIDVLFYGSLNPRRRKILKELRDRGLNVKAAFGVYGQKRDKLIARAKVVLNMHYYETKIFEIVRVSYLLANQRCVVSEKSVDVPSGLEDALVEADYEGLAARCEELVRDTPLREVRARQGFEAFRKISEREILERAITGTFSPGTVPATSGENWERQSAASL
jgi:hypothetical protein